MRNASEMMKRDGKAIEDVFDVESRKRAERSSEKKKHFHREYLINIDLLRIR